MRACRFFALCLVLAVLLLAGSTPASGASAHAPPTSPVRDCSGRGEATQWLSAVSVLPLPSAEVSSGLRGLAWSACQLQRLAGGLGGKPRGIADPTKAEVERMAAQEKAEVTPDLRPGCSAGSCVQPAMLTWVLVHRLMRMR